MATKSKNRGGSKGRRVKSVHRSTSSPEDEREGLTGDELLVLLLAQGYDMSEAAPLADLSERTAYRRLKDPDIKRRVDEVRDAIFDKLCGRLASACSEALDAQLEVLRKTTNDSVKLRAAQQVINNAMRLRDSMDLTGRIDTLQAQQSEQNNMMERLYGHESTTFEA